MPMDNDIIAQLSAALVPLLGAWTVIAISYDGTLWRLDNNPYRWTQI